MSDLPTGWIRAKVGEIADSVQSGFASGDHNRDGVGIPHIRPMNVGRDGRLILEDLRYVKDADGHRLRRGDVLFNNTNSAELVGKTTWIDIDRELAFSNHMTRVRLPESVSPEFLGRQLHHLWSRGVFELLCNNHVSQASVSARTLSEEVELVVPPAAEQKRIVAKIEELTARSRRAKEALDAVPPLLDQLRQSILAAAFRGDLTADWRAKNPNAEPAEKLIAGIRAERRALWEAGLRDKGKDPTKAAYKEPAPVNAEELPELPDGWAWAPAELVVEAGTIITYGIVLPGKHVEGGVPYVRQQDIQDGAVDIANLLCTTPEIASKYARSSLQEGDVLLCIIRNRRVAIVPAGLDGANITQGTVRFRPCSAVRSAYLAAWLASPVAQEWMQGRVFGLDMPRINVADTREIPVPVAPREEQDRIVSVLTAMHGRLDNLGAAHASAMDLAASLDQSILAKAFRGGLVPQNPSDEPASVLLERIRAARDTAEAGGRRQSRKVEEAAEEQGIDDDDDGGNATAVRVRSTAERRATKDINELDQDAVLDEVVAALWARGPLEKDDAVRQVAEHLRAAGYVEFQRLRTDGQLYAQFLGFIEAAVRAGRLDRPKRGQVRACKADATTFTDDDWRLALVASLGTEPVDREEAIRVAAEWARDNLGLEFSRLRSDGHVVEGLRSAINSGIRRGEVVRHDAKRISRASGNGRGAQRSGPAAYRVSLSMMDGDFVVHEMGKFFCVDGKIVVPPENSSNWMIAELREGIVGPGDQRLTFDDGEEFINNIAFAWKKWPRYCSIEPASPDEVARLLGGADV